MSQLARFWPWGNRPTSKKRPKMESVVKQEYDLGADTQHLKRKICLNDDTPTWVSLTWGHILFLVSDRWVARTYFPTMSRLECWWLNQPLSVAPPKHKTLLQLQFGFVLTRVLCGISIQPHCVVDTPCLWRKMTYSTHHVCCYPHMWPCIFILIILLRTSFLLIRSWFPEKKNLWKENNCDKI
jgi:hypothetical protein